MKIGFAAETEAHVANAVSKMESKGLAMIVANDAETTIDADDNTAVLVMADGTVSELPRMAKRHLAQEIVAVKARLHVRGQGGPT